MSLYLIVKTAHIINATIVFGTGMGIAFFMLLGMRAPSAAERAFAARMTVHADYMFTLPAVIFQPLSGAWLIWLTGAYWNDYWLTLTYGLYLLAGACWVPVVFIQIRLKNMLVAQASGADIDRQRLRRLFRIWFALGWPAFGALVVIFWLMVSRPSW